MWTILRASLIVMVLAGSQHPHILILEDRYYAETPLYTQALVYVNKRTLLIQAFKL